MTLTCFTTTGEIPEAVVAGLVGTITVVVLLPVSRLIWRFGGPAAEVAVAAAADTARRMLIAVTAVEVGIIRTVGRPLLAADGEPETAI